MAYVVRWSRLQVGEYARPDGEMDEEIIQITIHVSKEAGDKFSKERFIRQTYGSMPRWIFKERSMGFEEVPSILFGQAVAEGGTKICECNHLC